MSANKSALEQCLQQLITQGKRYGGYVTYEIINNVLYNKQYDISMDDIDLIYERLIAEGIEIVDQLPDSSKKINDASLGNTGESVCKQRRQIGVSKRNRRYANYNHYSKEGSDRIECILCPEEAVDKLIYCWETTGQLSSEYFLTIIVDYCLSDLEINQLIDYLGSKGIDVPEVYFYWFCDE